MQKEAAVPQTPELPEVNELGPIKLLIMAFAVGIIAGFGAVAFRGMIGFVHDLSFGGKLSFFYNTNDHTAPSIWGWGIILVPVIGSILVTWLVRTFAPEAKGHGVPEVMNAIYQKQGKIRAIVVIVKSIASAISIGTGGSVGREGPIIQIGSAFGSTLGQFINMPIRQRIVLIAAGAGAGIAATFNAPIGGIAFAIELMLVSINASTIAVVAVSTVTASYIGNIFFGVKPAFDVAALTVYSDKLLNPDLLGLVLPFGLIIGLCSALFIRSIYWFEDGFDGMIENPYLRHASGMLVMGILMYLFVRYSGHYYVEGVGYATITDMLKLVLSNPWFLLLLFVAKLLATGVTIGSGASGGIFSPALFLGAAMGSAFAHILNYFVPGLDMSPAIFAIAGMAGMVSGTTGAVLTAVTMVFEMTHDYGAVLPVILVSGIAYGVRVLLCKESIYTLKLVRRGDVVPQGLSAAITHSLKAVDVMTKKFMVAPADHTLADLVELHKKTDAKYTVIQFENNIIGVLPNQLLQVVEALSDKTLSDLANKDFIEVSELFKLNPMLRIVRRHQIENILVFKAREPKTLENLIGVITNKELTVTAGEQAVLAA